MSEQMPETDNTPENHVVSELSKLVADILDKDDAEFLDELDDFEEDDGEI